MNLIIENDRCVPEELETILEYQFKDDRQYWYWFRESFYPENRKSTKERFFSMKNNDNLICQTVFVDFIQLELMFNMLILMMNENIRINVYVFVPPTLQEQLFRYIKKYESEITPNTKEYDDSPKLRKEFKDSMNSSLRIALSYHNVYDMTSIEAEFNCDDDIKFWENCPRITISENYEVLVNGLKFIKK